MMWCSRGRQVLKKHPPFPVAGPQTSLRSDLTKPDAISGAGTFGIGWTSGLEKAGLWLGDR
jgi:hypothetical protein